jgi:ketosteroid isomerase-like protein
VQYAREIQFLENIDAFMRRDFAALEAAWRPDVVMTLPGSSWLAGTY